MIIDSILTKSGDVIYFYTDTVNNKPWFRITQQGQFYSSSYYDGDDLKKAKAIYKELLLAFKGIQECEDFNVTLPTCKDNSNQQLKSQPLFLGITDF